MRTPCPDALYGEHGVPNTQGKCPYCGEQIARRNWQYNGFGRNTGSISWETEREIDETRMARSPWGDTYIPPAQDPEIDPDLDDHIYD